MKHKVVEQSNVHVLDKLMKINEEYFNEQNMVTLKNSAANKLMKIIVCFVFNVV